MKFDKCSQWIGYIQLQKQFNVTFQYTISASQSINSTFRKENAILFTSTNRYGSTASFHPYWSICFDHRVKIKSYKFQEPNLQTNSQDTHLKSWNFYGSINGEYYTLIDSRFNMSNHHSPNYIGRYTVNNTGPFRCVKIEMLETFGPNTLTFRNFDVFDQDSYFPCRQTKILTSNFKIIKRALAYMLFIQF